MVSLGILSRMGFKPRSGAADAYPYDLDGSLRFVRPRLGIDAWPSHNNAGSFAKLGLVSGFLHTFDGVVLGQSYGKVPSGPITSALPHNLQWQITVPGLNKYMPQS